MVDVKQTVTRKDLQGIDETGVPTQQTVKQVHTESSADKRSVASNLVWYLFGVIAIILAARFVLKLAGANSQNSFVSFVYSVSHVLSAPFDSVFNTSNVAHTQSVFQPSILVAIAVYALLAWGIVKLINIATNDR